MLTNQSRRKMDSLYPDFYYNPGSGTEGDKRRFRRFHCKRKVTVFCGNDCGRVQDIGLGGLSFLSLIKKNTGKDLETGREGDKSLDLVFGLEEILAADLSSRIAYHHTIPVAIRRIPGGCYRQHYGLSFRDLSAGQLFVVKSIILRGTYI